MKRAFSIIAVLLFCLSGCNDTSLPVYEMTGSLEDTDSVCVIIDGVAYQALPASVWDVQPGTEVIGYAGSRSFQLIEAANDTARNFIFLNNLKQISFHKSLLILHRTDIPNPSADIVNRIEFYDQDYSGDEIISINNTITDEAIIQKLFEALHTGTLAHAPRALQARTITISCYSDDVPGASYTLFMMRADGRWFCGTAEVGYAEISGDLLAEIAGHDIVVNE